MLSHQDAETIKDAVHAVVDEHYRRLNLNPFNVTRLKQLAVECGAASQRIVDDPDAAALIEATLAEIVEQDEARGADHRIVPVEEAIPGHRRWQYR